MSLSLLDQRVIVKDRFSLTLEMHCCIPHALVLTSLTASCRIPVGVRQVAAACMTSVAASEKLLLRPLVFPKRPKYNQRKPARKSTGTGARLGELQYLNLVVVFREAPVIKLTSELVATSPP